MAKAEVRRGTREDALRLSLAANAAHGKQRTKDDYARAGGFTWPSQHGGGVWASLKQRPATVCAGREVLKD